jgi:hypothetical protein
MYSKVATDTLDIYIVHCSGQKLHGAIAGTIALDSTCVNDVQYIYSGCTSSCSSLHKLIGALNTGGQPSVIEGRMVGGEGKAYLFIAQTAWLLSV